MVAPALVPLSLMAAADMPGLVSCVSCAGIGVAGQALGAYLLATEMIGPTWRGVAGIITQVLPK
jgi:hypothetical protein